jgi:hypothetical protein
MISTSSAALRADTYTFRGTRDQNRFPSHVKLARLYEIVRIVS